eukprot:3935225-Pyramimonas_sp.AAC.1
MKDRRTDSQQTLRKEEEEGSHKLEDVTRRRKWRRWRTRAEGLGFTTGRRIRGASSEGGGVGGGGGGGGRWSSRSLLCHRRAGEVTECLDKATKINMIYLERARQGKGCARVHAPPMQM